MSVPPDSINAGKRYLMRNVQILRVVNVLSDGKVMYACRSTAMAWGSRWTGTAASLHVLARLIDCKTPCDWTPEAGGTG